MRRRSTLLLNIAIVLSLTFSGILSGLLLPTPVATGTSSAPVAAPGEVSPEPAARKVKRERKHDRKQKDRKQDRKQKDRKHDRQKDRKKGRADNWQELCTDGQGILLPQSEGCTHGPDPAPPGLDINRPVPPLSAEAARKGVAAIACDGNGQSGFRTQVLYVRGSNVPSRFAKYLESFRAWAGHMDSIFQASAAETGGFRGVRFVQDPVTCQPDVKEVVVTPSGSRRN